MEIQTHQNYQIYSLQLMYIFLYRVLSSPSISLAQIIRLKEVINMLKVNTRSPYVLECWSTVCEADPTLKHLVLFTGFVLFTVYVLFRFVFTCGPHTEADFIRSGDVPSDPRLHLLHIYGVPSRTAARITHRAGEGGVSSVGRGTYLWSLSTRLLVHRHLLVTGCLTETSGARVRSIHVSDRIITHSTCRYIYEYCFTSLSAQSWRYCDRRKPEAGTMPCSYFE